MPGSQGTAVDCSFWVSSLCARESWTITQEERHEGIRAMEPEERHGNIPVLQQHSVLASRPLLCCVMAVVALG